MNDGRGTMRLLMVMVMLLLSLHTYNIHMVCVHAADEAIQKITLTLMIYTYTYMELVQSNVELHRGAAQYIHTYRMLY